MIKSVLLLKGTLLIKISPDSFSEYRLFLFYLFAFLIYIYIALISAFRNMYKMRLLKDNVIALHDTFLTDTTQIKSDKEGHFQTLCSSIDLRGYHASKTCIF